MGPVARMIQLFCLLVSSAVALAPVQAQDYSDGWSLDPAEDPLLEDDDDGDDEDDDGDERRGGGPTLYYRDVNTGEIEIYEGRDDSVSGITESKVQRTEVREEVKAEVEEEPDPSWDAKHHGKHRRTHSSRSAPAEKPKTGSGGVGASSDDAQKDDGAKAKDE